MTGKWKMVQFHFFAHNVKYKGKTKGNSIIFWGMLDMKNWSQNFRSGNRCILLSNFFVCSWTRDLYNLWSGGHQANSGQVWGHTMHVWTQNAQSCNSISEVGFPCHVPHNCCYETPKLRTFRGCKLKKPNKIIQASLCYIISIQCSFHGATSISYRI